MLAHLGVSTKGISGDSVLLITGRKTVVPSTQPDATNWAVTLEQDPETGDLFLPLPVDLLSQMGWCEGTDIFWDVQDNGQIILREKKEGDSDDGISSGSGSSGDTLHSTVEKIPPTTNE